MRQRGCLLRGRDRLENAAKIEETNAFHGLYHGFVLRRHDLIVSDGCDRVRASELVVKASEQNCIIAWTRRCEGLDLESFKLHEGLRLATLAGKNIDIEQDRGLGRLSETPIGTGTVSSDRRHVW